ncbi:MAG: TIR domain-containing protein [Proteobacteria bacterium]|nr:TIR domain-containing protein [Pseudomonadota bacterium]
MPLVFISYSSDDRGKVEKLTKTLHKEKDIEAWIDCERIFPGDDIDEKMKEGIREADIILICLSPSFNSRPPTSWVKRELKMAILKEVRNQKGMIIPVRIKKGGEIPGELGTRAYADLSTRKRWKKNMPRLIQAIRQKA